MINLETETERYELARYQDPAAEKKADEEPFPARYSISRILNPYELDNDFYINGTTSIPLKPEYKEVIAENIDWDNLLWSDFALKVKKENGEIHKVEPLLNFKYYDLRHGEAAS